MPRGVERQLKGGFGLTTKKDQQGDWVIGHNGKIGARSIAADPQWERAPLRHRWPFNTG
jgi:hypothetical protein